jgi:hypothetical protein
MLCSTVAFAACSSTASTNGSNKVVVTSNTTTASGDKVGVAECDEYIEKMEACFAKMPEAQRGVVKTNFESLRKTWKDAASTPNGKAGLTSGCKAALDGAKQSYSFCTW